MQHFNLILLLHAGCASLAAGFALPTSTAFAGLAHVSSPHAQCSHSSSSAHTSVLKSFGVQRTSSANSSSSKRGRAAAARAAAYTARDGDGTGSSSVPAPYYPPTNFDRLQSMLLSENAKKLGVWAAFFLLVSRLKSFYGEFSYSCRCTWRVQIRLLQYKVTAIVRVIDADAVQSSLLCMLCF
jgi:hypothetical protein